MQLWAKPREICRTISISANPFGFVNRSKAAVDKTVYNRFIKKQYYYITIFFFRKEIIFANPSLLCYNTLKTPGAVYCLERLGNGAKAMTDTHSDPLFERKEGPLHMSPIGPHCDVCQ